MGEVGKRKKLEKVKDAGGKRNGRRGENQQTRRRKRKEKKREGKEREGKGKKEKRRKILGGKLEEVVRR